MRIQDEVDALSQIVSNDKIGDLSTEQLERYANVLCFSQAYSHFGAIQFPQVCETIRLLLLKRYFSSLLTDLAIQADESAKVTIKLTDETRKFTKRLLYLTWAIVFFTIIMVLQNFIEFPKYRVFGMQKINQVSKNHEQTNDSSQPEHAIPPIKK